MDYYAVRRTTRGATDRLRAARPWYESDVKGRVSRWEKTWVEVKSSGLADKIVTCRVRVKRWVKKAAAQGPLLTSSASGETDAMESSHEASANGEPGDEETGESEN